MTEKLGPSVQPAWCRALPIQQQSVLLLATRGPDNIGKDHPCKVVHVAYRATVLVAAKYGRQLKWGESADGFMSLDVFADDSRWDLAVRAFFTSVDALPHHYLMHFGHGAQIVGFKHPDQRFRERWGRFYELFVLDMHLNPETEEEMDNRLCDWAQQYW